ncbi:hypothetical protein [Vibrio fluvialis]|uniref:hypothetical protein n=1 Tax=Vibrio fluvialis TaxID=676 RepID=UPI001ED960C8|nr:hypothetical protein [Vibrio fluvialis]
MNTQSKSGDRSYFPTAGTLNNQLADIHHRLLVTEPEIDRISFALYDKENDLLNYLIRY